MKRLFILALSVALLGGSAVALAGPVQDHEHEHWDDHDRDHDRDHDHDRDWHDHDDKHGHGDHDEYRHDNGNHRGWEKHAYRRGERLPDRYYGREYVVVDYERYHVRRPEPGYRWVRDDDGQLILTAIATGLVIDIALNH
ncbi:RcnB family protein [Dyella soli]|uniref:Transmembrane signal peptide protein n=1 Tax=Dyella soli TaxID=522319 RepID=A0A4R0YRQ3_9GAMM|nr:RcnB family protein [Dyella soli]TCI10685.1 hypothetical protein EZM97_17675 [Dyella soli]